MLTREENEYATQVGPGKPMGAVFRRYWTPVCTSAQLPKNDSDPLRVRLFGENYVAFRNTDGKAGLLEELCMHRGASLALGRVENNGIRCLFHGWKFSVEGIIQETPNHSDPRFRDRLRAPAFPVKEAGGIVWAYVGPIANEPPFPHFAFIDASPENRTVIRVDVNANFLQLWEGGADSSHVGVLHSNFARPTWMTDTFLKNSDTSNPAALAVEDNAPSLELEETDFGFHYAAFRKSPARDGVELRNTRVVPIIMPSTRIIPAPSLQFTVFEVPMDDENTGTYIVVHGQCAVDRAKIIHMLGLDDERYWSENDCRFKATWADRFGQHRAHMLDNWSGFSGVEKEDAIIALSQGALYDRSKEHLVAADRAVVRLRRLLIDSARRVEAGQDPIGINADMSCVHAYDRDLSIDQAWQQFVPGHKRLAEA